MNPNSFVDRLEQARLWLSAARGDSSVQGTEQLRLRVPFESEKETQEMGAVARRRMSVPRSLAARRCTLRSSG